MNGPALTVLMTVRNGEPYLAEAVASILNQTYGDFRFLILDNASTDQSREIIQAFRDPRIDLVELPEDIGQTAALNRGLEMVDTPWVARMDADDVSLPQRLELQMAHLERHPQVVLLGTAARLIDGQRQFMRDRWVLLADKDIRWQHLVGRGVFVHSSVIFAASAVARAGGYPAEYRYAQDYALWWRLLALGQVANIPECLVYIRYHASNTTDFALAEQEIRAILQEQLYRLFPKESDSTLAGVATALRGLSSNSSLLPSSAIVNCLAALAERFVAAYGCRPSRGLLWEYGYHWLFMARRASLSSQRRALAWIKVAFQVEPTLWANVRLWYTLVSVALAPVWRQRTWSNHP